MSVHRHKNSGPNFVPYVWISCLSRFCPVIWRSTCFPPVLVYSIALFVCQHVSLSLDLRLFLSLSRPYWKNIINDLTKAYHRLRYNRICWAIGSFRCMFTASALCLASSLVSQIEDVQPYNHHNYYITNNRLVYHAWKANKTAQTQRVGEGVRVILTDHMFCFTSQIWHSPWVVQCSNTNRVARQIKAIRPIMSFPAFFLHVQLSYCHMWEEIELHQTSQ